MNSTSAPEHSLPQPKTGHHAGKGMLLLALILLCVTGGGIWWATRDDATRETLRRQAEAELIKAQNSAVATVMDAMTPPQRSPLPEVREKAVDTVASGPDQPQAQTQAQLPPSPEELALMETMKPGTAAATAEEAQQGKEDRIVRPAFVENAARWMASCYHAEKDGTGRLRFTAQWANARFSERPQGVNLPEMDSVTSRAALLRYILRPGMLQTLYGKYGEGFMQAFDEALRHPAKGAPLSDAQLRDAYRQYSNYLASVAGGLDSIAATPDLAQVLQRMESAGDRSVTLNSQITEAVFHMDEAREAGNQQAVRAAQERINVLTTQYRLAINEKDAARQQALNTLKKRGGRSLDNATVLFLAQWVNRRMSKDKNALEATKSAAAVLRSLASRMQQKQ